MKEFVGSVDPSIIRKKDNVEDSSNLKVIHGFPLFTLVEFNIYGACNRKCSFCPVSDPDLYKNIYEGISVDLYTKVMNDLKVLNYEGVILFSAFSEPFLHPELLELTRITKEYLPNSKLEFVTNGDIAIKKPDLVSTLFAKGLDTLNISVYDGPDSFINFTNFVKGLKLGNNSNRIVLKRRFYEEESANYGIIFSNRTGLIDSSRFQKSENKEELPMQRVCNYPFYQFLIDYNGDMQLCPHDWGKRYIVGNLENENIWSLWTSKKFEKARTILAKNNRDFPPCANCDVKGDLMGKANFEKWNEKHEQ